MTPTTPSPISDQAAGELLPCPFCGSESKSDNGFSPCESIEYAWCSNQDCSLCTIEFGFTVEEWNRRAAPSPMQKAGLCEHCNGSGIDGGRMHIDERGASEYEPYRCELCDGFGRSTAPTTGSAPEQFPYQKTFDAIAAATSVCAGRVAISVIDFRKAFGAAPASPAASALTDEELTALIRKVEDKLGIVWFVPDDSETYAWRTTNTNERLKYARALLSAHAAKGE